MMTDLDFRKRVREIKDILGHNIAQEELVRQAVKSAQYWREMPSWPPVPRNEKDKEGGRQIASALRKLKSLLGAADNAESVHGATYGASGEFAAWESQLGKWRSRFEAYVGDLADAGDRLLGPSKTEWPPPLDRKKKHSRVRAEGEEDLLRRQMAARVAARLLTSHGIKLTATQQKSATQKGSSFCRVAAVLFGDNRADLYHYCRKYTKRGSAA